MPTLDDGDVLLGSTGWENSQSEDEDACSVRARAQDFLGEVLQAETLVVLAGLGTSLGVTTDLGKAPSMADLWDEITRLPQFADAASRLPNESANNDLEGLLSEAILRQRLDPAPELESFITAAEAVVLAKCRFVESTSSLPAHERLMRKLARRSPRGRRAQIFTTNYDQAFEVSAATTRTTIVDGFGLGGSAFFDGSWFDIDFVRRRANETTIPEPNVVQLFKMHGSVDWSKRNGRIVRTTETPDNPVLIYPAQNKYELSYAQPYQEIMSRFQMALRGTDVGLLVIGFGFRDNHITAPIEAALRANTGLKMAVIDPALNTTNRSEFAGKLASLVEDGDERVALIARKFADGLALLPDIRQRDELADHVRRVEQVLDED